LAGRQHPAISDIHYYEGLGRAGPVRLRWCWERSYRRISKQLNTQFDDRRRPFFLYASANDMEQSNITEVGDGHRRRDRALQGPVHGL